MKIKVVIGDRLLNYRKWMHIQDGNVQSGVAVLRIL